MRSSDDRAASGCLVGPPDDVTPTLRVGLAFAGVGLPLAVTFAIHQTRLVSKLRTWEQAWAVAIVICTAGALIGAGFYIDAVVGAALSISGAAASLFLGVESLMLPPPRTDGAMDSEASVHKG
jgi:hypothetical protein